MKRIDSKDNPKIKYLASLKDGKGDAFLVEGRHMVEEAIKAGRALEVYSTSEVEYEGVETYLLSEKAYAKITSLVHPEGIAALCEKSPAKPLSNERILVLDGINDPGNLGTILRTARAFGYLDVVMLPPSCSPYSSKALMASQGAVFMLNLARMEAEEAYPKIKEAGYKVLASDLRGKEPPEKFKETGKLALVLGSESHGIGEATRKHADIYTKIGISGVESLNVAVAGGILMHVLRKG